MLITEQYKRLNEQLHKDRTDYGISGHKYARQVQDLARQIGASTILDYGCGKRTLERALGYAIANYDPAIAGCEAPPEPADLVVCTDVLEHIEVECLAEVLDDLKRVTKDMLILMVATRLATKKLADGTNAHKIVEQAKWWLPHIMARFTLVNFVGTEGEFFAICKADRVMQ